MNLIEEIFKQCADDKRAAFVAYIAAGDPDFDTSLKVVDALIESGVDILELGIPFSDPLADGEANQLAAERALLSGMTSKKALLLTSAIRKKHPKLPLVLFTYMNPIAYSESENFAEFCEEAVKSGISAILPLDLPPEEIDSDCAKGISYRTAMANANLPKVTLIAPTTSMERIKRLAGLADAFIYYVSREGVTGESDSFSTGFSSRIESIKQITETPVVVGFGISTPDHVKKAASTGVDGVVIGSAIVRKVESISKGESTIDDLKVFVKSLTSVL